jgi:hypothetical protein
MLISYYKFPNISLSFPQREPKLPVYLYIKDKSILSNSIY